MFLLILAYPGSPGQKPLNGVCVCVCESSENYIGKICACLMEKLMNEENEWDHKISAEVKLGIRMAEVRAVLKKMKRHNARGLSWLVAEMIQATGDVGTQRDQIVGTCYESGRKDF